MSRPLSGNAESNQALNLQFRRVASCTCKPPCRSPPPCLAALRTIAGLTFKRLCPLAAATFRVIRPLRHAFGDDLGRSQCRFAQIAVACNLPLDALTLIVQEVSQALQLENELVDLLHRCCRHPLDEGVDRNEQGAGPVPPGPTSARPGRPFSGDASIALCKCRNQSPVCQ